jgi:hypothetical protein
MAAEEMCGKRTCQQMWRVFISKENEMEKEEEHQTGIKSCSWVA